MEAFAKLIEALAHLLGVLTWPVVVVYLAYKFGPVIGEFIKNIQEGSLKAFGFDVSAKKVFANIDAAITQKKYSEYTISSEAEAKNDEEQKHLISEIVTPEAFRQAFGRHILWVDDKPEGNDYEIKALRELGYRIKTVTSSDEAVDIVKNGPPFDLVISDLSRPEGPRAGFDLLQRLRELNIIAPFLIYTGTMNSTNRDALRDKAKQLGAFGCTSNAGRLIKLVLEATKYASAFK